MTGREREREAVRAKFVTYRRTRDRKLRNELIETHSSLAAHVARRFANRGEPLDDLLQVANLGMLKAVERFDPDRQLEFSTYATVTIEGELKRHFRDRTWSIRVPRRSQELFPRLVATTNELTQRLRRAPRVDELARELQVSEDEVIEAMDVAGAYHSASLDERAGDRQELRIDELGDWDEHFSVSENQMLLEQPLSELPERERTILRLRFVDDMTQTEIAQQVGISQMHVSRLLTRTLGRLREQVVARLERPDRLS